MSAVKEGKGLATIEDIAVACLGILLERRDTLGLGYREKGYTRRLTFQRCLGRRTARCSFLRNEREVTEEEGEASSAVTTEVVNVRKRRGLVTT